MANWWQFMASYYEHIPFVSNTGAGLAKSATFDLTGNLRRR